MRIIYTFLLMMAAQAAAAKFFISPYVGVSISSINVNDAFKSRSEGFKPMYGLKLGKSLPLGLMLGAGYDMQNVSFKAAPESLGMPATGEKITYVFGAPFHTVYALASYRFGLGLIALTPSVTAGGFFASSKDELPEKVSMGNGSGSMVGGSLALEVGIKRLSAFGEVGFRQYSGKYDGTKVSVANVPAVIGVRISI